MTLRKLCSRGWRALFAGALLTACASPAEMEGSDTELDARATDAGRRNAASAPDTHDEAGASDGRDATRDRSGHDADAPPPDDGDQPRRDAGTSDVEPARVRSAILWPERWVRVAPADDPFDDGPAIVSCSATAVMAETLAEENVYSVDTGACNYLTAAQPTVRAIAAGELLKVRLWHFALSADEPAQAHAAVLIDGVALLDERVPIPSAGGLIVRELRASRDIQAGALAYFHLHNHGDNSWSLVEVSGGPAEP